MEGARKFCETKFRGIEAKICRANLSYRCMEGWMHGNDRTTGYWVIGLWGYRLNNKN